MEEREVLTKLGFHASTDDELKKAREELGSLDQLKYYDVKYDENNGNYFELIDKKTKRTACNNEQRLQLDNSPKQILKSFFSQNCPILPVYYYAYGRVIITGWRTCLHSSQEPCMTYETQCDMSWIKKRHLVENNCSTNVDKIMIEVLDSKNAKENLSTQYRIDEGHIFGRFTKVNSLISKVLHSGQNSDNINTYPQYKYANRDKQNNKFCQLYFETEAKDHLPCYYETEAIFRDWNDRVPLGTRIRIIGLDKNNPSKKDISNDAICYHVLIPNCEYVTNTDGKKADVYQRYFQDGNVEKLFEDLNISKGDIEKD